MAQHRLLQSDIARFGVGIRHQIRAAVDQLTCQRALVLSTPTQCDAALATAADLGPTAAGVFAKAIMHTPVEVTQAGLDHARDVRADCLVAIGGGSTTGLGKAIAYRTGLPLIAIPTTYAGSEATPILGQTENGLKTTLSDPKVAPKIVLYDPQLIVDLPIATTVASALNAMAHAAEAFYAANRCVETDALANAGFTAFAKALPRVIADPHDLAARLETQRGAWACGRVLGLAGMGLHHKLCHTLGGTFGLPHAETHAIILSHAIAYNARSAGPQLAPICAVLGGDHPGHSLYRFATSLGAPTALRDLGLRQGDLDRAADLATQTPYPNPHPITKPDILALLQAAWAGHPPVF